MDLERIKEIHQGTAYPESVSVMQALLLVWNECELESRHNSTSQQQTIERLREMLSNLFYLLEDEEFTYEVDLAVMDAKEEFDLMKLQDSNLNTTEPIDQ